MFYISGVILAPPICVIYKWWSCFESCVTPASGHTDSNVLHTTQQQCT